MPAARDETDAGHVWGFVGMVILYGFGISGVFAALLAWVLAYLLRPVRNQWIHIGAFLAVPPSGSGCWEASWVSAIGRWAIRKDVLSANSAANPV